MLGIAEDIHTIADLDDPPHAHDGNAVADALDDRALSKAVEAIRNARRVEVFGVGSAATIAEDTNYRLLRIGIASRVNVNSHIQAITASLADYDRSVQTLAKTFDVLSTKRV